MLEDINCSSYAQFTLGLAYWLFRNQLQMFIKVCNKWNFSYPFIMNLFTQFTSLVMIFAIHNFNLNPGIGWPAFICSWKYLMFFLEGPFCSFITVFLELHHLIILSAIDICNLSPGIGWPAFICSWKYGPCS